MGNVVVRKAGRPTLQFRRNLLDREDLDAVANLEVLEVVEADAALLAGAHLLDILLEVLEGRHKAGVYHVLLTEDLRLLVQLDCAACDTAAANLAGLGDVEDLRNLRLAHQGLPDLGGKTSRRS